MTRRPDFWSAQLKAMTRYIREGRKTRWLDCIRRLENARLRFDDRRAA